MYILCVAVCVAIYTYVQLHMLTFLSLLCHLELNLSTYIIKMHKLIIFRSSADLCTYIYVRI